MLERSIIPGIDDFDPSTASPELIQSRLTGFCTRLQALVKQRGSLEAFRKRLDSDRPYCSIVVESTLDENKKHVMEKHFYLPLENGGAEQIRALLPEAERQLKVEIEWTKVLIRRIVDFY